MRAAIAQARHASLRFMMSGLMRIRPVRAQALIFGVPDSEENSLQAAIFLARRYSGRTILLCTNLNSTRRCLQTLGAGALLDDGTLELALRSPLFDLVRFARAEMVFYTHGLLGSPQPVGSRFHVNLWHGTGPKRTVNQRLRQRVGASALSGPSRSWGRAVMADLSMPRDAVFIPAAPRMQVFRKAPLIPRAELWRHLELDPDLKTVLWLPTYRKSDRIAPGSAWEGNSVLSESSGGPKELRTLMFQAADASSIQLIVKPHPLDAENPSFGGLRVLSTEDIWKAGASLYQFLALVDGLISDYSSVWVDCLALNYPIGLFCPDFEQYKSTRGLANPRLDLVAKDLFLESSESIDAFFQEVQLGNGEFVRAGADVATLIGFECPADVESAFINELRDAIRTVQPASPIPSRLD